MEKTSKSEKWSYFSRNDRPPINSVHVKVWNCFLIKVQAMVAFLLISLRAKTVIQNMDLSASLVQAEFAFWNCRSGSGLVLSVFSLGRRPAVSGSLLIITHSYCLSIQRAFL